jgi:ketosteroid isomerase-like protein
VAGVGDSVRLARRYFALLAARELEPVMDFVHPDVVFVPRIMRGRVYQGKNEVRTFYEEVFSWPLFEPEAATVTAISDSVAVVEGRIRWMTSGSLSDQRNVWVLTFAEGKLIGLVSRLSRDEALETARLFAEAKASSLATESSGESGNGAG